MSKETEKTEKQRRLTPAEWQEAKALWELGRVTLRELSERFGISEQSMSDGLKRNKAVKGSRAAEIGKAAAEAAVKAAIAESEDAVARRKRRIEETREQHYQFNQILAGRFMRELKAADDAGQAIGTRLRSIQALRLTAAGLRDIRAERYAILNADAEVDEGQLPELVIRELTDAEVETMRSTDDDDGLSGLVSDPEDDPLRDLVVEDGDDPAA